MKHIEHHRDRAEELEIYIYSWNRKYSTPTPQKTLVYYLSFDILHTHTLTHIDTPHMHAHRLSIVQKHTSRGDSGNLVVLTADAKYWGPNQQMYSHTDAHTHTHTHIHTHTHTHNYTTHTRATERSSEQ